jgi:hypothetical protein
VYFQSVLPSSVFSSSALLATVYESLLGTSRNHLSENIDENILFISNIRGPAAGTGRLLADSRT